MLFRFFNYYLKRNIRNAHLTLSYQGKDYSYGDGSSVLRAKIVVHRSNFFSRVLKDGEIGLGESYVAREWSSPSLKEVFVVLMLNYRTLLQSNLMKASNFIKALGEFINDRAPDFTKDGSKEGVGKAYNVGNDFFRYMLGETLQYTCAIFKKRDNTLEEAQKNKIDVIIQKMGLSKEHKVLDIGCGWGTLLNEIHQRYGCQVRGIALAEEQIKYCKETYPFGQFDYLDYRDLEEKGYYDRVVSVGMIEHVGIQYWQAYADKVAQVLKPNGRALLHTMIKSSVFNPGLVPEKRKQWSFSDKWIMPCINLPYDHDLLRTFQSTGKLRVIHQEKFGVHYGETMRRWGQNVLDHADEIRKTYPSEIVLAYEYMWAMSSACFATGIFDLWQVVVEKSPCTLDSAVYDPRSETTTRSKKAATAVY